MASFKVKDIFVLTQNNQLVFVIDILSGELLEGDKFSFDGNKYIIVSIERVDGRVGDDLSSSLALFVKLVNRLDIHKKIIGAIVSTEGK